MKSFDIDEKKPLAHAKQTFGKKQNEKRGDSAAKTEMGKSTRKQCIVI